MSAHILVVDDHDDSRLLIRRQIERRFSVDVVEASSADDAIAKLKKHDFRLIICDLEIPGGSGLDVYAFNDENVRNAAPFILLTGAVARVASLERDGMIVIEKPNFDELLEAMEYLGIGLE